MKNSNAVIRTGGDRAFYSPSTDHIQLPPENAFQGPGEYAATALHELGHWTGHETRLNRDLKNGFGSAAYAMEELRAELSSAFIAGQLNIPTDIPNHASYIEHWLGPLKKDRRKIFRAAADAQRIADIVMRFHPEFAALAEPTSRHDAKEDPARSPTHKADRTARPSRGPYARTRTPPGI